MSFYVLYIAMRPLIRLVRETGNVWTERRFFDLRTVRRVTGQLAIDLDLQYLKQQSYPYKFPTVGSVLYSRYYFHAV